MRTCRLLQGNRTKFFFRHNKKTKIPIHFHPLSPSTPSPLCTTASITKRTAFYRIHHRIICIFILTPEHTKTKTKPKKIAHTVTESPKRIWFSTWPWPSSATAAGVSAATASARTNAIHSANTAATATNCFFSRRLPSAGDVDATGHSDGRTRLRWWQ